MAEWQRVTADLLWRAGTVAALTDAVADEAARGLVASRLADRTPALYYDAIGAALASDTPLTSGSDGPHGEEQFRDFLRRVRERMDALRPWPDQPFVQLPVRAWAGFGAGRAIGRIRARFFDLERGLLLVPDLLPGDDRRRVLMLRLGGGAEVAILGSPGDTVLTLIRRPATGAGAGDQAATIGTEEAGPAEARPGGARRGEVDPGGAAHGEADPGAAGHSGADPGGVDGDDDSLRAAFTEATGVPVEAL
jgi:hypothetical protein